MNPAGAGTNIIQQALPSPISPMSPYASWASSGDEDPLEQFVDALGAGTTVRTSTPIGNAPPAGAGTAARLSPVMSPQASVVGVGGTTPRRLTAAERGKQAAGPAGRVAQKQPRRTARPPTPSSPSDAGSRRRSSGSNGSRRRSGGGCRSGGGGRGNGSGGGGGGGGGDDDDGDTTPSSIAGPSRRR